MSKDNQETNWFSEARFGMFIHWGLYSILGGEWHGKTVPWVSEWIMNYFRIPVKEYECLAHQFNPTKFDAEKWVKSACDAGMKYIIFTTKHHDGFAMFKSTWDNYNIVDATPFKRDVLAELAAACRKYDVKLGCYYSQDQDWHEPYATGNDWDFPPRTAEQFHSYLNGKVKHQLKELLTNYGDIAVIWFDTPAFITPEESQELKDFVHALQPSCLVSGRVGNGLGDYTTLGDNALPDAIFDKPAEGLGTMNASWGYKKDDHAWRSSGQLLETLAKMIAHNANYLLNVGPMADGTFPMESQVILQQIAFFMEKGKCAVYGAHSIGYLPFAGFPWGEVTTDGRHLWLWIFRPQEQVVLYGVKSPIKSVKNLWTNLAVPFIEAHDAPNHYHKLTLSILSEHPVPYIIEATLNAPLEIEKNPYSPAHTDWYVEGREI